MALLNIHSKNLFRQGLDLWAVEAEQADVMFNYLVYGYGAGSFYSAVLANDALGALSRSHPGNSMTALKKLAGWMRDCMPETAYGSYQAVDAWLALTDDQRRAILEQHHLIYTPERETWMSLQGDVEDNGKLPW